MKPKTIGLLLMLLPIGIRAQSAPRVVRDIASVQTVCSQGGLAKSIENNQFLYDLLSRFYVELEQQFRVQVQRTSRVRFAYLGMSRTPLPPGFGYTGGIVSLAEADLKCDARLDSYGEIEAIDATTFRVSISLGIRRNATSTERSLSLAEKGNLLTLWHHALRSNAFTADKLRSTAGYHALQFAADLASATKRGPGTR